MKAVVMAGGVGSRLRPLTIERPKPMVPLMNKPVLGHILELLKRHNITEVVITVQYLASLIQDYFGNGSSLGMTIHYSVEETPLGTAGSVKNAQKYLDDTFIVISGDALTNFDITSLVAYHKSINTLATLALYSVSNPIEYGVITLNNDSQILRFQEKPGRGSVMSDHVNTGIYVLEPEILDYFGFNVTFDFAKDLFPMVHERGHPVYGYVAEGYWCDVGNIPEYMRATADCLTGKVEGLDLGPYIGNGIWASPDVEIAPDAHLEGPIYLGRSVQIKSGAVIRGPTSIRDYTVIDNEAQIDRSIFWRNCYVGERAQISGAVVMRQCSLKNNCTVFEGAVIGDGTIIGEGAIIHPSVKIWPGKEVEPNATVNSSIIWGSQGRRALFGRFGVTGVVNIDLTPEFSAKLGASFGATLPKGAVVTLNRDMHRSPRMIKRAIISGLPSAGVNVSDLGSQPLPVVRYYTQKSDAQGGIHVHLSPFDQRLINIQFMDSKGFSLTKSQERSIEHIFFREDYRRVYMDDIGSIDYAQGVRELYLADFFKMLNTKAIRDANFYLVVDYGEAPIADMMPAILDKLQCNVVALNANANEARIPPTEEDFRAALGQLQTITKALGTQLGVRMAAGGEKLYLVDNNGMLLDNVITSAAMVELAFRDAPGSVAAVPIHLPIIFEKIAQRHGGSIIRTEIDTNTLIKSACNNNVIIASDGEGSFIFPDFQCAVDGLMALAKMLEFLATQEVTLSEVVAGLPTYHMAERKVSCVWEAKARVMRLINEKFGGNNQKFNGVRVMKDAERWVFIVPDPEQPLFRIIAEADSQDEAEALVDEYANTVEKMAPLD